MLVEGAPNAGVVVALLKLNPPPPPGALFALPAPNCGLSGADAPKALEVVEENGLLGVETFEVVPKEPNAGVDGAVVVLGPLALFPNGFALA